MSWCSLRKGLAILGILVSAVSFAYSESPVYWEPTIDSATNQCAVKVVSRVRLKDVRCEVVLFDNENKQIASRSVYVTDNDNPELTPEKEYIKHFSTGVAGAKKIEGVLLFGNVALSSPKAASDNVSDELKRGVPPRGSGELGGIGKIESFRKRGL